MSGRDRLWWVLLAFWAVLLGLDLALGSGTVRWSNAVAEVLGIVVSLINIRAARGSRASTEAGGDT